MIREEKDKEISHQKSLRGVFNQYADKSKLALENTAWQNHVVGKYKKKVLRFDKKLNKCIERG